MRDRGGVERKIKVQSWRKIKRKEESKKENKCVCVCVGGVEWGKGTTIAGSIMRKRWDGSVGENVRILCARERER